MVEFHCLDVSFLFVFNQTPVIGYFCYFDNFGSYDNVLISELERKSLLTSLVIFKYG